MKIFQEYFKSKEVASKGSSRLQTAVASTDRDIIDIELVEAGDDSMCDQCIVELAVRTGPEPGHSETTETISLTLISVGERHSDQEFILD